MVYSTKRTLLYNMLAGVLQYTNMLYNMFAAGQLLYNKVRWWQTRSELCCTTLFYNMLYNKVRLVEYGRKWFKLHNKRPPKFQQHENVSFSSRLQVGRQSYSRKSPPVI